MAPVLNQAVGSRLVSSCSLRIFIAPTAFHSNFFSLQAHHAKVKYPGPTRETSPDPHRDRPRQHRHYDGNRTQSPSPPPKKATQAAGSRQTAQGVRIGTLLNNDELEPDSASSRSRSRKSGRKTRHKKDATESIAHPSQLHTSLMPEQSSHHSSPHPHNQEAIRGNGPPLLPSNSHNPYNDPQIPYSIDGQLSSPVGASGTPTVPQLAGNKRPRATATAEQTRKERVRCLLDEQVHEERAHKRHVRARRGPLIDSWVKCSMLPDGWDSDEDELGRWAWGGFDEIVRPTSAQQVQKSDEIGYGDVGDQARQLARGLRCVKSVLEYMMKPDSSEDAQLRYYPSTRGVPVDRRQDDDRPLDIPARPARAGGILQTDGTIDTTNQRPNKRAYRARTSAASRNANQHANLAEGEAEEARLGNYKPRVPNPSNTPNLELSIASGRGAVGKEGARASGGGRRSGGGSNRSRRREGTGGAASSSSRRRKAEPQPVDPDTGAAKTMKPPAKRASGGRAAPSSSRRRPASNRAKKAAASTVDDVASAEKSTAEGEPAVEPNAKDISEADGGQDEDTIMRDAEEMHPRSSSPAARLGKEGSLDVDAPAAVAPAPDSPSKPSDEMRAEREDGDAKMDVDAERGDAVRASAEGDTATAGD